MVHCSSSSPVQSLATSSSHKVSHPTTRRKTLQHSTRNSTEGQSPKTWNTEGTRRVLSHRTARRRLRPAELNFRKLMEDALYPGRDFEKLCRCPLNSFAMANMGNFTQRKADKRHVVRSFGMSSLLVLRTVDGLFGMNFQWLDVSFLEAAADCFYCQQVHQDLK